MLYHWYGSDRVPCMDRMAERVRRLAEAVRRSAEVHSDTVAGRNAEILAAHDAGMTLGALAKATGLRRQTIMEIVVDGAAARPPIPTDPDPGGH